MTIPCQAPNGEGVTTRAMLVGYLLIRYSKCLLSELKKLQTTMPKGEKHPNYGKFGENSKSAKPVIRKDPKTGEIKLYKAKILAKDDGFDVTSISKCCHGKLKTHKGYEWYFAKDSDKDIV